MAQNPAQNPAPDAAKKTLPFNILIDLPSPAEWHKRSRQACGKFPALDKVFSMIEQGWVPNIHGRKYTLDDQDVTEEQAELLFYLMTETRPILTVETGFHHGLVSAVMTLGHMANGLNGGHVPIQDQPREMLDGIGFYTMERLELTGYQIMEHETGTVLPQMYLQKLNQGLSLVYFNQATDFDEQMMEYFFLNRLLGEGGIMAVNTAESARRALVDYVRKERHDYAVRDTGCGITLIQTPHHAALAGHQPDFRH